jgi:archaellin
MILRAAVILSRTAAMVLIRTAGALLRKGSAGGKTQGRAQQRGNDSILLHVDSPIE